MRSRIDPAIEVKFGGAVYKVVAFEGLELNCVSGN